MKSILVLLFGAAASLGLVQQQLGTSEPVAEPVQFSPVHQWQITDQGGSARCFAVERQLEGTGAISLTNNDECSKVHHSLVHATGLVEDEYGNMKMIDGQQKVLFEFSSAEFDGYESVYPEHPILTIEPVR